MRPILQACCALIFFAVLPAPVPIMAAAKEPPPAAMNLGGGGPLEITAGKSLEWHQNDHKYLARGAATAVRGEVTISAEELAAYERPGADKKQEIYKLTAQQNVKITTKQQQIYGDEGYYDADRRVAILTGKDLRFVSPNETVTARDALEYWQDKRQAIARGQAVAVRDKRRIEADLMTAQFQETKDGGMELQQLTATGNVVITTASDIARGTKAVYDIKRNTAVLSGNVRVTRGASQLNGSVAEVDFKTGISRMTAAGKSGRVRALFVPSAHETETGKTSPLEQP